MSVKVLIKRQIREGKAKEVFGLLNKFRSNAMEQKGYISGETLYNHDNPNEILVISTWQSPDNWIAWKENEERKANEILLERWLAKSTEYSTFVLGTSAHFSK
jgi:heme-degrading monooxygenase HmoA